MYISRPGYWSKVTLEIGRDDEDFQRFFGTICIRNVPLLFEVKFLRPIEIMNFKEGLKETSIRRILFAITIKNLSGIKQEIREDKEYNFFYNLLISYAVKLHHLIKNNKMMDRHPEIDMTTLNWSGTRIPETSDIFTYAVKTSEIPEFIHQKFLKIKTF